MDEKSSSTWKKAKVPRGKHHDKTANTMLYVNEKDSSNHSSESNRRKTVGVTIRPDLLAEARKLKVNLSKTLEKSLEQLIQAQNEPFFGSAFSEKKVIWCGRRDLNPSTRLGKPGS